MILDEQALANEQGIAGYSDGETVLTVKWINCGLELTEPLSLYLFIDEPNHTRVQCR